MVNIEIIIILLLLFVIEYFFLSNDSKKILIYFLRYILINFFFYIIFAFCFMKEYFFVLTFLFVFKIVIDKVFVFKKIEFKVTDWEKYYEKKPLKIIEDKRKNNIRYIINVLKDSGFTGGNILEYGGGNSFVAEEISKKFDISKFTIVDSNSYGIKLLDKRSISNLEKHRDSIFEYSDNTMYDLTYSVGLIEHFQGDNLIKCIDEHFKNSKKGSYVLFTFPVVCFRYNFIRTILEVFNMWQYTDEVPLRREFVEEVVDKNGEVVHSSVNDELILPQAIVMVKRG